MFSKVGYFYQTGYMRIYDEQKWEKNVCLMITPFNTLEKSCENPRFILGRNAFTTKM